MRERVAALLDGRDMEEPPRVSTFHSFCVRVLRRDGDPLAEVRPGFTRRFTIYDEDDQLAIVKATYRNLGLDEKEFMQYRAAISRISQAKNPKETPQDFYRKATDPKTTKLAVVFEQYEKRAAHRQRARFRRPAARNRAPAASRRRHARGLQPPPPATS